MTNDENKEYGVIKTDTLKELKLETIIDIAAHSDDQAFIERCADVIISREDPDHMSSFAVNVKGTSVERVVNAIIENGNPYAALFVAQKIQLPKETTDKLADIVLACNDGRLKYKFAVNVSGYALKFIIYFMKKEDYGSAIAIYEKSQDKKDSISLEEVVDAMIAECEIKQVVSFVRRVTTTRDGENVKLDSTPELANILEKIIVAIEQQGEDASIDTAYELLKHETDDKRLFDVVISYGDDWYLWSLLSMTTDAQLIEKIVGGIITEGDIPSIVELYEMDDISGIPHDEFAHKFENVYIDFDDKTYTLSEFSEELDKLNRYIECSRYNLCERVAEDCTLSIDPQPEPIEPSDAVEEPIVPNQELQIHGSRKTIGSKIPQNK